MDKRYQIGQKEREAIEEIIAGGGRAEVMLVRDGIKIVRVDRRVEIEPERPCKRPNKVV